MFLLALVTACRPSSEKTAEPAKSIVITAASTIPSAPSISATAQPLATTSAASPPSTEGPDANISMAHYEGDRLDACIDLSFRLVHGAGTTSQIDELNARAEVKTLMETARKTLKDSKDEAEIKEPCAQTFKDRLVLATCTIEKTGKAGTMQTVIRRYLFETALADDKVMRQCLKAEGGKWEAIAHDSEEFRRAQLESQLHGMRAP